MTPERAADVVVRWVRFYTRDLPVPVAEARTDEVASDLYEHIAYERAEGTSDRRIALRILSRMVRGVSADMSWRWKIRPLKGELMKRFGPVLVAVVGVIVIGLGAIVFGEADDAPGLVMLGLLLIVAAVAFGASPVLRTRSRALGLFLGAIALALVGSGIAGWLEETF